MSKPVSFHPAAFLTAVFAGWMQRGQQRLIDYFIEENRVLKAKLGKRRIRFNDADRARLARAGKVLGRATIATPDTILRWHRRLVAAKGTFESKKTGRPRIMAEIERLIVRMARDNPTWGYERIQGALKNLGHRVAESTVDVLDYANRRGWIVATLNRRDFLRLTQGTRWSTLRSRRVHS